MNSHRHRTLGKTSAISLYGYRFYNPSTGRWMTRDPFGEAGGINLYGFVLNDPVNHLDPEGLEIRIYSSDAFGVSGLNHAFIFSTETGRGRGMDGSSGLSYGDGVGSLKSPYVVVENLKGLTENEFMDFIESYSGWERGVWFPWINDCHSQLDDACDYAGVECPDAPGGRID